MAFQQTNIDYRVIDSTKYPFAKKYGYKQLSRIGQKQYQFKFMSEQKIFQFQIQFNVPAIINSVQIKAKFINQVLINLYKGSKKCCGVHFVFNSLELRVYRNLVFNLQEKSAQFTKATVKILNYNPMSTCFKERMAKRIPRQATFPEPQQFLQYKKHSNQKTKIEKKTIKQRQIKKTLPSQLVQQVENEKYKKINKNKQKRNDSEIRKSIEIQKQQARPSMKGKKIQRKVEMQAQDKKQYYDTVEEFGQFFQYDVTDWGNIRNTFENVKPQWVQAQRKAERQCSIQYRHSIAQKIKLKIFQKMEFYINQKRQRKILQVIILQLGGNILKQPKSNCYIVTNKNQINLSTKLEGIKFITSEYIKACNIVHIKLDQSQYKP